MDDVDDVDDVDVVALSVDDVVLSVDGALMGGKRSARGPRCARFLAPSLTS